VTGLRRHEDHGRHAAVNGKGDPLDQLFVRYDPILPWWQDPIDSFGPVVVSIDVQRRTVLAAFVLTLIATCSSTSTASVQTRASKLLILGKSNALLRISAIFFSFHDMTISNPKSRSPAVKGRASRSRADAIQTSSSAATLSIPSL
jgi:hypothetical protein